MDPSAALPSASLQLQFQGRGLQGPLKHFKVDRSLEKTSFAGTSSKREQKLRYDSDSGNVRWIQRRIFNVRAHIKWTKQLDLKGDHQNRCFFRTTGIYLVCFYSDVIICFRECRLVGHIWTHESVFKGEYLKQELKEKTVKIGFLFFPFFQSSYSYKVIHHCRLNWATMSKNTMFL